MAIIDTVKVIVRSLWRAAQPALRRPRRYVAWTWRRCSARTTFIAITGSNGKTTATRVLAAILARHGETRSTLSNRNGEAGITETIASCRPWRTRYAIIEIGAGQSGPVAAKARLVKPDIAIVLSVFLEHRSLFRTLEAVAKEKATLLAALLPGGVAVLNADDPRVDTMPVPIGVDTIRCGARVAADVRHEALVSRWPEPLRFTAVVRGRRLSIRTRLLGAHWVNTLLACIAVADRLGVPDADIIAAIENVPPYPGRMQTIRLPNGAIVIRDEFKAGVATIDVAFAELAGAKAVRKLIAFGDVSDAANGARTRLARIGVQAAGIADELIFVGEHASYGTRGALRAGMDPGRVHTCADDLQLAALLARILVPGDLLLLKADRYQLITRGFYRLLGEVRCERSRCGRQMVCDDCEDFDNPALVRRVNEELAWMPVDDA